MNKRGESELSRGIQILLAALGLIAFVFAVIYLVDLIQKNIELNETGEGGWAVLGLVIRAMFVYIFAFGAIFCGIGVMLLWFYRLKMYDENSKFDKFLFIMSAVYTVIPLGIIIAARLI